MKPQEKNLNMDELNYIKVYDGFLPDETCNYLIKQYEYLLIEKEKQLQQNSLCFSPEGKKLCGACDCMRVDMMQHEIFEKSFQLIMQRFQLIIQQYKHDVKLNSMQWPNKHGFENLKLKRYLVDKNQQHALHVDSSNWHTAKRFLAIICYLNDDFDEGETEFPIFDFKITPKKGRVVMFPPLWSYLHAGLPPKNGYAKYIIGTHLNYLDMPMELRSGDVNKNSKLSAKIGNVKVL